MNLLRKDMEEQAFFLEMQRLSLEMDAIVKKHGMSERVASILVVGLVDSDDFGDTQMQAIYSYSLDSKEELESITNFINNTWEDEDDDEYYDEDDDEEPNLDDLIGGLGIELE